MRRKIFQEALPEALSLADTVLFGPVNRAQLLEKGERLSPEDICELIRARGRNAEACNSADDIANRIASAAKPGDMVLIMSNGGFDGLTAKLLEKFRAPVGARG
jgi:UDP-N-acetylmuramate: L-alanyl-gamma-D-glutamyl-meso-diaminopimelate ligase